MIKLKDLLIEVADPVLNEPSAQNLAKTLQAGLNAPYVEAYVSMLGGKHRPSVMVRLSLDPKNEWAGGIYHNSRIAMFDISHDGAIDQFTVGHTVKPKFRKARFKTPEEVLKKLNDWIAKAI